MANRLAVDILNYWGLPIEDLLRKSTSLQILRKRGSTSMGQG